MKTSFPRSHRAILAALGLTLAVSGAAMGQAPKGNPPAQHMTGQPAAKDVEAFLQKVHSINLAEIQAGNLAEEKGAAKDVKEFGREMVTDHTAADQKVAALAGRKNVNLDLAAAGVASDVRQLDERNRALGNRLAGLSGAAFDQAYVKAMVDGHKDAVAMVRKAKAELSDKDAKTLAADLLPTLEKHLKHAESLGRVAH